MTLIPTLTINPINAEPTTIEVTLGSLTVILAMELIFILMWILEMILRFLCLHAMRLM